ncbi:LpxI family protein [Roseovarius spongiae]|uniref:LpxI family protein n=1 Tax=Roseovarius spongiae TaxID=2320272 RepID=A0A3A8AW09_9RHOB|nr:UDP-2,3-diacylglucosamine diphosphatase LpxI [Roseovarius spongiae]RKF15257.1 LpxI family protein [Roseovarius spongiae]
MAGRLAIVACGGALPVRLAEAHPNAMLIALEGIPTDLEGAAQSFALEEIGALFDAMRAEGVARMVFAGTLARPPLNPARMDAAMLRIAPRLMQMVAQGDDALLRFVISVFEDEGFAVLGAHELLPDLTAAADLRVGRTPDKAEEADIARAHDILVGISSLDIGQGCAVAGGQCLGVETVQGTDAILRFIKETPDALRRGARGVYLKMPKRGQDLRIDMPAIGPRTVHGVADAGLGGLVIAAGQVVVMEPDATRAAAEARGVYLISRTL